MALREPVPWSGRSSRLHRVLGRALIAGAVVLAAAVLVGWRVGVVAAAAVVAAAVLLAFMAVPAALLRGWWRPVGGLAGIVVFVALVAGALRMFYGGGAPYGDLSTPPQVSERDLEALVDLDYPPGNVAISDDGRVFFNYHPFAQAQRFSPATVFELVNGVPRPFPDAAFQAHYQGTFGMTIDRQHRLWLIEPASIEHERTRLLAFDLTTRERVFEHWFAAGDARFAQDLRVSPDGKTVYLADTGLFRFTPPGLIVVDLATRTYRTLLADSPSTQAQDWVIRTPRGPHKLAYGLLTFQVGLDGIAVSDDGAWLYYGAMSHDRLFKVPTAVLRDPAAAPGDVARRIEAVGTKPLSDGIALDRDGGVLITDIEHGGIARLDASGKLQTLVKSPRVLWADGIALAPDGAVVFTDSAIPAYVDQLARPPSLATLTAGRPYHLFRFRAPRR